MLILDYMAYGVAGGYIDFISTLTWFRMYCEGKFGKSKKDYLDSFDSVKNSYENLWWNRDKAQKDFSLNFPNDVEITFQKIANTLSVRQWGEKQSNEIANTLRIFLDEKENDFRQIYFDFMFRRTTQYNYSEELYSAVSELLKDQHNDEAVLTSFKYLDNHLQKLLMLSPHENYGEDLINKTFAPNTGILQLGTNPNEQVGLRNFFSGANAVFRNPSAHRFSGFEAFDAATVVSMVAVMAKIASQLAKRNQKDNEGNS